ncbi:MAG: C4-type zinc ribbon domain-containing protein [Bacteroidia bacterium]
MAAKKPVKAVAKKSSAKPAAKKAAVKKAPVKKKAVAKPAAKKPAVKKVTAKKAATAKKAVTAKPAKKSASPKTTKTKATVKEKKSIKARPKETNTKVTSSKEVKKTSTGMSKTDTKAKTKSRSKKVEEPVITKVSKPVVKRLTETRNLKAIDTGTAAKLSSKYSVGDISQFQIKMPKKGVHDASAEEKLQALFQLQQIDSEIDRIQIVRGELPVEVKDLEDDVARLETRISNINNDMAEFDRLIAERKQGIKDSTAAIKKYEGQQNNVKNNREYESLAKEIEFQKLEIQLCEKRIKEYTFEITSKKQLLTESEEDLTHRKADLENKRKELDSIIAETRKEEDVLNEYSSKAAAIIEERLLSGYKKIRENAANGLAVVSIQRDSCGGCFNKVPPQRQLEIKQRKKVIVCEHCGRILVDQEIMTDLPENPA